jgi:hypothetical protein
MKLKNIHSITKNNKKRLSGQLVLDSGKTHEIYFEVERKFESFISDDATPFLAAALPISMKVGEELEIEGSVSKHLLSNTAKIMKLYKGWNIGFNKVKVNAKNQKKDSKKSTKTGLFFSGGADSFYTYLKNKSKIDYLIFVHGFDINSEDNDLFKTVEKNILKITREENKKIITVKTNIRDIFEWYFDWDMSHSFAIPSVALFLRFGLKEIFASCGLPNKNTDHHFMTPELDSLWSTEITKINHYGCSADKISKLSYLSNYKIAMSHLRVCWTNPKGQYNCCECEKCLRNMLALYLAGALGKAKTFNKSLNLKKLSKMRFPHYTLKYFLAILEKMKQKNDTSDVRVALEKCIEESTSLNLWQRLENKIRQIIRHLDKTYNRNRFYWLLAKRGLI